MNNILLSIISFLFSLGCVALAQYFFNINLPVIAVFFGSMTIIASFIFLFSVISLIQV